MALREARRFLGYNSDAETFLKQACDFRKVSRSDCRVLHHHDEVGL